MVSHRNIAKYQYELSSLSMTLINVLQVGNLCLLPLKTSLRGPAPAPENSQEPDIVDEALALFRANCLFRNYEIMGSADRVLLYLILWISDCLTRILAKQSIWTTNDANKQLQSAAVDHFALPGDPGFPINNMYDKPTSRPDAGLYHCRIVCSDY